MNQEQRETADRIMASAERRIWVTFQKVGFHRYPTALTDSSLQDVAYLGHQHRHLFKFKIWIDILHNDREIEFHQFLNYCESLFETNQINIDYKSVEMLADELYIHIADRYPGRAVEISVSEDGENGCLIKYETHRPHLKMEI